MQNQKSYWKAVLEAEVDVDFDILMGGQDIETILEKMRTQQDESVRTLKVWKMIKLHLNVPSAQI